MYEVIVSTGSLFCFVLWVCKRRFVPTVCILLDEKESEEKLVFMVGQSRYCGDGLWLKTFFDGGAQTSKAFTVR